MLPQATVSDDGSAGLTLILDGALDADVAALCRDEVVGLGVALSRWGRFTRPVKVLTTGDRAALRQAAGASSSELLCALATLDTVTLLSPQTWTVPPAHGDLYRAILHELAHVLMFQRCTPAGRDQAPALPVWMREGMAAFVAEGAPLPNERRVAAQRPDLLQLARADATVLADSSAACYQVARLVFAGWLGQYGERHYAALCRGMRNGLSFAQTHVRACGITSERFIEQWVEAVTAEARTG